MIDVAEVVDGLLESTVVGSFSRLGFLARRRLFRWDLLPRLDGKIAVVTGSTGGLGFETAVELAALGAGVRLVGRDPARAAAAVARVRRASGADDVAAFVADVGEPESVRALAAWCLDRDDRLDVLVHNAGALSAKYLANSLGVESTVATHVVGPWLLTELLTPRLRTTAGARVITVTSGGMYAERFDIGRLEMRPTDYRGTTAYARAKRAQTVLTGAWVRRYGSEGIAFHAMHPGWVDTPGLHESLPGFARWTRPILRTPAQGVDTVVWLAATPTVDVSDGSEGHVWLDRRPRSLYKLPRTRSADPIGDGDALAAWCAVKAGSGLR